MGAAGIFLAVSVGAATTNYVVRGVVKEIDVANHQLVIAHESISNFMGAMTMPFNVKDGVVPSDLAAGATIRFDFHVNDSESWIDGIKQIAAAPSEMNRTVLGD